MARNPRPVRPTAPRPTTPDAPPPTTAGNDVIRITTAGVFLVNGLAGDDNIRVSTSGASAGDGPDRLYGGLGNDTILAAGTDDFLYGGLGDDVLRGDDGDDTLDGDADEGQAEAIADAQGGADILDGGRGNDRMFGRGGDDQLLGGHGDDFLDGGSGTDILFGSLGDDFMRGGAGADRLFGGVGIDTADYSTSAEGVTININSATPIEGVGGDAQGDRLVDIENLIGSAGNDSLTGSSEDNVIRGGAGADFISGAGGTDTADYSRSARGPNNEGVYVQILGQTSPGQFAAVTQNSTFFNSTTVSNGEAAGDRLVAIENVVGSDFNDVIVADAVGTTRTTTNNVLDGGAGNDILDGGNGNDTLIGGAGRDQLFGGAGIDTADYSRSTRSVVVILNEPNAGTPVPPPGTGTFPVVVSTGGATALDDAEGDRVVGVENVIGTNPNAETGSNGADELRGNSVDNVLEGLGGADILDGGSAGSDTADYTRSGAGVTINLNLTTVIGGVATVIGSGGDAQNDRLISIENVYGSRFADTLTGTAGNNLFQPGAGADTVNAGDGTDTIDYSNSTSGVTVLLDPTGSGTGSRGYANGDTLTSIENIYGSDFADTLRGGDANNVLRGGAGADTLDGGGGINTADYQLSSAGITVALDGSAPAAGGEAAGDQLSNIQNINGTLFDDRLTGSAADNRLEAGAGNDVLIGGAGADRLDGGSGVDMVDYSDSTLPVFVQITGNRVNSSGQVVNPPPAVTQTATFPAQLGSGQNGAAGDVILAVENVIGSAGNDYIAADAPVTPPAGFTQVSAANVLDGGAGNDQLLGRGGDDTLFGGLGNDILSGGNENDALDGGDGVDYLIGGSGTDVYRNGIGIDYIVNYEPGENIFISSLTNGGLPSAPAVQLVNLTSIGITGDQYVLLLDGTGHDTYVHFGSNQADAQLRANALYARIGNAGPDPANPDPGNLYDVLIDPSLIA